MIEALIVRSLPLTFLPLLTGYYAYNHGRSFWRGFALGVGLPFFSLLVVAATGHRDQRRRARALAGLGLPAEQLNFLSPPNDPPFVQEQQPNERNR